MSISKRSDPNNKLLPYIWQTASWKQGDKIILFMIIGLTGDYFGDANIDDLLSILYTSLGKYFKRKTYSKREPEIFIVLVCQPKELKLRRRYSKKENVLYYDIILNYGEIKKTNKSKKKEIIAAAIVDSLNNLDKYNFEIDVSKMKNDMKAFFQKHEWLKSE